MGSMPPMSSPGWPDPSAGQPTGASGSQPMYPPPYGQTGSNPYSAAAPYGQPAYGQPAYGQPGAPAVAAPSTPVSGLAVAALVLGILAGVELCGYLPYALAAHNAVGAFLLGSTAYVYDALFLIMPVLAVIFGHMGKNAVARSGGRATGGNLALTGLIIG